MSRTVRSSTDDAGFTLVGVMGAMFVLMLFAIATLTLALDNMKPNRTDQDAKAAVAAAQAGIDDYISRLNADGSYYAQGNGDTSNPAFSAAGRSIPGTGGAGATYQYQVLSSFGDTVASNFIRLRSTGKSNGVKRTLTARLTPNGFLQYIYHTDKENLDPQLYAANDSRTVSECDQYYYAWDGKPGRQNSSRCIEIQFAAGDVIDGPLHTNDAMQIGGAILFKSPKTESSWSNPPSSSKLWWGSGTPSSSGYKPVYAPLMQIPVSNASLKKYADPSQGGPGCLYTGATKITFQGDKMTVLSPNTTTAPSRCYNVNGDKATPQSNLAIPPVIYVQDLAGTCAKKSSKTVSLGYPLTDEYSSGSDYVGPDYSCNKGTAYVSGNLDGQTTIGTAQDIVAVGDITYQDKADDSDDILGLIPTHFVWVYHPISYRCDRNGRNCSYDNMLSTPVTEIDAAILTVSDSFIVQNYDQGPAISTSSSRKLTVFGAMAQNFRGTVATSSNGSIRTGYLKNYVYDRRFARGAQPPYFLTPRSTTWSAGQISDG
jgi:hypothetical protein